MSTYGARLKHERLRLKLTQDERNLLINNGVTQNLTILKKRINELGITEASVQRQGQAGIRIELPGVHNPKQAKEVIGATASLAFHAVRQAEGGSLLQLPDRQHHIANDQIRYLAGENFGVEHGKTGIVILAVCILRIIPDHDAAVGAGLVELDDLAAEVIIKAEALFLNEYQCNRTSIHHRGDENSPKVKPEGIQSGYDQ